MLAEACAPCLEIPHKALHKLIKQIIVWSLKTISKFVRLGLLSSCKNKSRIFIYVNRLAHILTKQDGDKRFALVQGMAPL